MVAVAEEPIERYAAALALLPAGVTQGRGCRYWPGGAAPVPR